MIGWLTLAAVAGNVQRYAVVLGTNEGLAGEEVLQYAESDAERFAGVLEDLGDVRSEDIISLRRVDAERVRSALDDLAVRIERHADDAETLLFFYYSGHADSDALHLNGSELSLAELTARLAALPVDVRVMIVDACKSGELTRLKGATPAEPFEIRAEDRLESEGMAIITSSSAGEDAQESDRLGGGMFTHHFVAGLMGAADSSGDQRVTLTEAYRYGYTETIRSTSRARFVQHPSYAFELRGQSDLVLTRLEDPGRNGVLGLSDPGSWLVFAAEGGALVTEVTVVDNALLVLAPGGYLVRLRGDHGVWEQTVEIERGETVELRQRQLTAVSWGATVRKGLAEQTRAAWAVAAGGGLLGAPTEGLGVGPQVRVGSWVDLEPMTLGAHLVGSTHGAVNDQLTLRQGRVGADLTAVKKLDVGATAVGLGLRTGGDLTLQWFATRGDAPARQAVSGRVGPLVGFDAPLGSPRSLATLQVGADIQLYRRYDPVADTSGMATAVVPTLSLEVARYVR